MDAATSHGSDNLKLSKTKDFVDLWHNFDPYEYGDEHQWCSQRRQGFRHKPVWELYIQFQKTWWLGNKTWERGRVVTHCCYKYHLDPVFTRFALQELIGYGLDVPAAFPFNQFYISRDTAWNDRMQLQSLESWKSKLTPKANQHLVKWLNCSFRRVDGG